MELYNRILMVSRINLPEVRNATMMKSIELLGGYLCTLTYFTPLQLYTLFQTINLIDRTRILTEYYQEYITVLQEQWKYFNEQNSEKIGEEQQKEHVREVYEHVQTLLGHKADLEYIKKIKKKLESGRYPEPITKLVECQLQNIQDLGEGNPEINRKKYLTNYKGII